MRLPWRGVQTADEQSHLSRRCADDGHVGGHANGAFVKRCSALATLSLIFLNRQIPFSLNPILIPINKNSIYEILANAKQIVRAGFVSTDSTVILSALHENEHGHDCHSPRDRGKTLF